MPRVARVVAEGFPHHVTQRGNNKEKIFFDVEDRYRYLSLLIRYRDKWETAISSYCLMENHIHLQVTPSTILSLAKMMHGVAQGYTCYLNKKYHRTGRLWGDRFFSCNIDTEDHFWAVARYIEQNPRRAKLVSREEDYAFSSARAHVLGTPDPVLNAALFNEKQRKQYATFLHESLSEADLERIREAARYAKSLGNQQFIGKMGQKLRRQF